MLAFLFAVAMNLAKFEVTEDQYLREGRYDRMLDLANRMLEDPHNPDRAAYLHARGLALSQMHKPEAAWAALEEALPLAQASGNLEILGAIHRDRAIWIWRFQRDRPRALREFDTAIDCGRRARAWFVVTSSLHTSANMFRAGPDSDLPEALRRLEEALAISRREHTGIAHILNELGDVYRRSGDLKRAEATYEEAAQVADRTNIAEVRWESRSDLAQMIQDRDPSRAETAYRDALDLLEAHQADMLLEDFRPGVLAGAVMWSNPYDGYINLLLRRRRPNDAFLVAERERARAFLQTLTASRDVIVLPQEREIHDQIKSAQSLLRTGTIPDAKRAGLVASIGRYESDLTDLRLKLAVDRPSAAHARFPKLWPVADIQSKLLGADEALIAFHLGHDQSVAWVITRQRASAIALGPQNEIETAVRKVMDDLRNPLANDKAATDLLSRLLQIDVAAKLAGTPRVVIVPDGILNDVPFEALSDGSGHPLVERFAIAYAPSASSLAFLRSLPRPDAAPASLIAVANPVVGASEAATLRQADLAHLNLLAPLPQSATEAERIAGLFGRSGRVLEGARATRSALSAGGAERASILHFATHGLIDETRPERSGLVLTADPPHDDGLLQVRDIYSLRLNADLVTLSACETALGANVTGEGVLGLTRAFFFAGARSVVASMWDVDDASTSDLMQRFYANIRAGQSIDIALQHAKIDFVRSGKSPFYWAAFVISGNARTVMHPPPASPRWLLWTMVSLALAGVYLWIVSVRGGDTASDLP